MLTSRNHRLAEPTVVIDGDNSVVVEVRDRHVRTHTSGRTKGAVEHTELRFHFDSRREALNWFAEAYRLTLLANPRPGAS